MFQNEANRQGQINCTDTTSAYYVVYTSKSTNIYKNV